MSIVLEEVEFKDEQGNTLAWVRQTVERETLLKKVKEVFPAGTYPAEFAEMTLIAWIKADIEDRLGYKRFLPILRKEGFDV